MDKNAANEYCDEGWSAFNVPTNQMAPAPKCGGQVADVDRKHQPCKLADLVFLQSAIQIFVCCNLNVFQLKVFFLFGFKY